MIHWHRCRRWWRHGLECPYSSLVEHEDDDEEDGDPDLEKIPVPGKKKVEEDEEVPDDEKIPVPGRRPVATKPRRPGRDLTDEQLRELGGHAEAVRERNRKIQEEAEKVVDEAPRPIPNTLEPVGNITDFLPPPPPARRARARARTAAEDARVVSEEDEVKGKSPTLAGALARAPVPKSVGLAAALTMNQLSRLHPTLPPPHRKAQLALDEEVVVQEFVKAPQPSGFGFKAKQIGFIVGGAAAGIGAAFALGRGGGGGGGGSFAFNAAARLRGQLTTGAFP